MRLSIQHIAFAAALATLGGCATTGRTEVLLTLGDSDTPGRAVAKENIETESSWVYSNSRGEQRAVLEARGVPDMIWRRQAKLELWAYCDVPSSPILVEFNRDGRLLSSWKSGNGRFCSSASEI